MKEGTEDLTALQHNIGYHFNNRELLDQALTHKSFANEMQLENSCGNERLEFMGDAVLELVISHILMERFEESSEGRLSKMRAAIVNRDELARCARTFDIGRFIRLSRGENEDKGRIKKSILANVYEAIVAAVYYDGGYTAAFEMIERHFSSFIDSVSENGFSRDYKSRLQEYAQKRLDAVPTYVIVTEQGPDHIKIFESRVEIDGVCYETGRGSNKKSAEQEAARNTLQRLLKEGGYGD